MILSIAWKAQIMCLMHDIQDQEDKDVLYITSESFEIEHVVQTLDPSLYR